MIRRLLICGNSHICALRESLASVEGGAINVSFLYLDRYSKVTDGPRTPLEVINAHRFGQFDAVAFSLLGNYYNVVGMFNHRVPFHLAELGGTGVPLTRGMLSRHFEMRHAAHFEIAKLVLDKFAPKIRFVFSAPPPIADEQFIRANIRTLAGLLENGLAPLELRLELYRLQCAVIAEQAQQIGATFVQAPEASVDAQGYLRPEFFKNDSAHANGKYGELVLRQLAGLIEEAA